MIAPFFARVNNATLLVRSVSQMRARSRQINTDLLVILHQQNACSSISKDEYLGGPQDQSLTPAAPAE
jgi:hypothetical protein